MTDPRIKALCTELNKKLEYEALKLSSEVEGTYLLRRPSGIFSLDLATAGGLPAGTMVKIGGIEGIGKNYLANCYIAECQRLYRDEVRIFLVSGEYPYDKLKARDDGVRIALTRKEVERFEEGLKRPLAPEEKKELTSETGEIVLVQGLSQDKALATVIDLLESDLFHIGLIDSMDSLLPEEQEERDLGDPKVGSSAQVQTDFVKRFYRAIGRSRKTLLITLGQARANIPTSGGMPVRQKKNRVNDPYAMKHAHAGKIVLSQGDFLKEKGGRRIGKVLRWVLEKGKAGFHDGPTGEMEYYYRTGVDKIADAVEVLKQHIERRGAWYYIHDKDGEELKFNGLDKLKDYLFSNPDVREMLQDWVYEKEEIAFIHHEVEKTTSNQGRGKGRKKTKGKKDS